jgi:AcrR family transcriptional regulator
LNVRLNISVTSLSPAPKRRSRPRRVGRPRARASAADVRADLLAAARAAFSSRGYAAVSLRDVAKQAGTTAAMVHYYFGDKDGLFAALLESALTGVLERVRSGLAERAKSGVSAAPLDFFFDVAQEALGATPWIPQLILREVLTEGAPFRERFVESYARPMSQLLRGALLVEIGAGRLRADLDVDLALTSLLGMAAFPFIAQPVLQRTLGLPYDADFRRRLGAHAKRLFLEGARA